MIEELLENLTAYFVSSGLPVTGTLRATLLAGGRSNLTYRLDDEDGRTYVVRRPPGGPVLPSAHDMSREYRIVAALGPTPVPVAEALALCEDPAVLGVPFYVMGFVPGVVLGEAADVATYPVESRAVASDDLVDVLAEIHRVDVDAVGLGELGRREDYCVRQLKRWRRQYHAIAVHDLPVVDEVHDRLAATVPPQRHTGLVHGDYRPGNTMLDTGGRVRAVLDWELATLGDTLADIGYLAATWNGSTDEEMLPSPTGQPGFADREQVIERYGRVTGRDVSDLGWYQAFALWRLTCISEGVYARYLDGAMGEDGFDLEQQDQRVRRMAEASLAALSGIG